MYVFSLTLTISLYKHTSRRNVLGNFEIEITTVYQHTDYQGYRTGLYCTCSCEVNSLVNSLNYYTYTEEKLNFFFLSLSVPLSPLLETVPSRGPIFFFSLSQENPSQNNQKRGKYTNVFTVVKDTNGTRPVSHEERV
jgi:hypothetical protein